MKITIQTPQEEMPIYFKSEEEFTDFRKQINEALRDESNTKFAFCKYVSGDKSEDYIFPASILKNSIIRIQPKEAKAEPFFF